MILRPGNPVVALISHHLIPSLRGARASAYLSDDCFQEHLNLLGIANLSWISVVLLVATLAIMTTQVAKLNGGHLPQHAPKALPPGVLALDGWADRLIVLSDWAWVLVAASCAIQVRRASRSFIQAAPRSSESTHIAGSATGGSSFSLD